MINRTITVKTELTVAELAGEVCSLSAEQLAEFFDLAARRAELWGHGRIDAHMDETDKFLTQGARRLLRKFWRHG